MSHKARTILLLSGAVGLLFITIGAGVLSRRQDRIPRLDDYGEAPDFALTDQFERPVRSTDFAGRVIVASFIYTNCPDICPVLSLRMQQLQERLGTARLLDGRVQLLSFTVDPDRDTPTVLRTYAERHGADPDRWRFLTGHVGEIVPLIVDGFRLGVEALPPRGAEHSGHGAAGQGYEVTHSGRFVLIDRRGRIRAYYDGAEVHLSQVVRDIRALLR